MTISPPSFLPFSFGRNSFAGPFAIVSGIIPRQVNDWVIRLMWLAGLVLFALAYTGEFVNIPM